MTDVAFKSMVQRREVLKVQLEADEKRAALLAADVERYLNNHPSEEEIAVAAASNVVTVTRNGEEYFAITVLKNGCREGEIEMTDDDALDAIFGAIYDGRAP